MLKKWVLGIPRIRHVIAVLGNAVAEFTLKHDRSGLADQIRVDRALSSLDLRFCTTELFALCDWNARIE